MKGRKEEKGCLSCVRGFLPLFLRAPLHKKHMYFHILLIIMIDQFLALALALSVQENAQESQPYSVTKHKITTQ